jgi:peroxiredoxin
MHAALKAGDRAPDFTLPNGLGRPVSFSESLRQGPAVVTFYRGGWCPYSNIQLRAYQRALKEMTALGGKILAISPRLPDGCLSTAETNQLRFDALSDVGNHVARSFGLVHALADERRTALQSSNKALPSINGDDSWARPATCVNTPSSRIAHATIALDFRQRLSPEAVIAALRSARTDGLLRAWR